MTSTADMTQHPDVSEISDLLEGLLSTEDSSALREHLDDCALCTEVYDSLEQVRELLGTVADAGPMPTDIADRLDAALTAERENGPSLPQRGSDVSRETSPPHPGKPAGIDRPRGQARGTSGPGRKDSARAGRGRRRALILGSLLTVVVLGASVPLVQTLLSSESAPPSATEAPTRQSGPEFRKGALEGQVRSLTGGHTRALGGGGGQRSSAPDDGGTPRLLRHSDAPPSCVQQATGRSGTPLGFEKGRYESEAAYLLVFPDASTPQRVTAYVVAADCESSGEPSGELRLTETYELR
ncbi:anti-sigma factor family protein [Streptomyces sp. NPDC057638]|uniref:anti-sigma factor family protein n=1 Tax=Streptomyces sp. NPDC057638 TaxID=3346190 RepID=UPI0036B932A5